MSSGGWTSSLSRGFLPTWFAAAGILAIQMLSVALLPESPDTREVAWSTDATALAVLVAITVTGAWAFPRVRPMTWLVGALCTTLLTLQHTVVGFHEPVPPTLEVLAFYSVGAVLLAVGAWERARWAVRQGGQSEPG